MWTTFTQTRRVSLTKVTLTTMNLNKVSLIGNLTDDPVAHSLPSGQPLTRFGLATNYVWRDAKTHEKRESAEFHSIVAWGKLAEIVAQYVKKGSKIYVEGRLRTRTWKDRAGQQRRTTEVVAGNVIMLGHRTPKSKPAEQMDEQLAQEEVDVEHVPA